MTRDLVVGVLFLGAILIVGAITVLVSGIPAGAADYRVDVRFQDVAGLQEGDPVRIRGFKNGDVYKISFSEEEVVVTLRLFAELPPRAAYVFEVLPSSPLGGMYVKYDPGKGDPVPTDAPLLGKAGSDLFAVMGEILAENREDIRNAIDNLQKILQSIDSGDGLVSALFRDPAIRDNLSDSLRDLRDLTQRIIDEEGALGALISNPEMRDDLAAGLASLRQTIDQIRSGEGTVGALIYDPVLQEELENIFARTDRITRDIEDAKGLIGALLHDEALKQHFEDFARGASNLMSEIQNGQGALPKLLNDPALGEEVSGVVRNLSDITGRIRNGPGTAYSLIYDDTLYQRTSEAMALLRDTTEDAREQAPISTFFGILFAPF
jgi:phospholipid/cholesterol/gamma-HCH transport system substrate-binding protein